MLAVAASLPDQALLGNELGRPAPSACGDALADALLAALDDAVNGLAQKVVDRCPGRAGIGVRVAKQLGVGSCKAERRVNDDASWLAVHEPDARRAPRQEPVAGPQRCQRWIRAVFRPARRAHFYAASVPRLRRPLDAPRLRSRAQP